MLLELNCNTLTIFKYRSGLHFPESSTFRRLLNGKVDKVKFFTDMEEIFLFRTSGVRTWFYPSVAVNIHYHSFIWSNLHFATFIRYTHVENISMTLVDTSCG